MPLAPVTGAARLNSIAAGIVPRLSADGWEVVTSNLDTGDYPCDLSDDSAPAALIERIVRERGRDLSTRALPRPRRRIRHPRHYGRELR